MTYHSWLIAMLGTIAAAPAIAADLPTLAQNQAAASSDTWGWLDNVYLHVGPAGIITDAGAKIYTPAGRYPGATIKIAPEVAAAVEVGYRITPNWAVSITGGVPPTGTVEGAGSVAALGRLGSATYGPVTVTGHYHLTTLGRFQPYIGGGPTYLIVFNSHDGVVNDFQVRSAWGVVGQVGADYMVTEHLGAFVDFKKAYLRTTATGSFAGVPLKDDVKLDPYVVSGGMTYRF